MHHFRATAAITLALTLAAAGSVGAQDKYLDWGTVEFNRERGLTTAVVAGPADSVWRVLESVMEGTGVKIAIDEPTTGRIGNQRFRAVRRLGKEPLSRLFSCGNGMTGPNADSYHVFIGFVAAITPAAGNRTRLQLQVTAEAIDVPGGRSERIGCFTTGRLEYGVIERLDAAFPGTR